MNHPPAPSVRCAARVVAIAGALLLTWLPAPAPAGEGKGPAGPTDGTPRAVPISVATAEQRAVQRAVEIVGTLYPADEVTLSTEMPATIARMLVDVGDSVKKGQLLVKLDDREARIGQDQAAANLRAAHEAVVRAKTGVQASQANLERTLAGLAVARAEADRWRATIRASEADMARAGASVRAGEADVERAQASPRSMQADIQRAEASVRFAVAEVQRLEAGTRAYEDELRRLEAAVRVAEAEVAKAMANAEDARRDVARMEDLYQQKAVARSTLDVARTRVEVALAQIDSSRADVEARRAQLQGSRSELEARRAQVGAAGEDLEARRAQVRGLREDLGGREAQVRSSQAEVEARRAQGEAMEADRESKRAMLQSALAEIDSRRAQVAAAEAQIQNDLAAVKVAEAAVEQVASGLEMMKKRLQDTEVLAPIGGIVRKRHLSAGETVKEKTPILTLVNLSPLKLRGDVPERFAPEIAVGKPVRVEIEAFPGRTFPGTISRINPAVEIESRAFQIEALVPNPQGLLKPGSFAKGQILTRVDPSVVFIPEVGLVTFAGITKVFMVKDGTVEERRVKVGTRQAGQVEITEGVQRGERIATSGLSQLASGVPVRVSGSDGAKRDGEARGGPAKAEAPRKP